MPELTEEEIQRLKYELLAESADAELSRASVDETRGPAVPFRSILVNDSTAEKQCTIKPELD